MCVLLVMVEITSIVDLLLEEQASKLFYAHAGTLLNQLFGTDFEVAQGRHPTTKGLWLGIDEAGSTLIIDVEGVDSSEGCEDYTVSCWS